MRIGEGFAGEGIHAAHVNTLIGSRDGPVGTAWATAIATPSQGHAAFQVVVRPGLPVHPPTLFVNKATLSGGAHAGLTWGPAQAGVAGGVADALADGLVDDGEDLVLIVAVWVDPGATDAGQIYANNRSATRASLANGLLRPDPAEVIAAAARPFNPFFDPDA